MSEAELDAYLRALVRAPSLQALWRVTDRGMPVFAHSVDVTLLCLEAAPLWRDEYPGLDIGALVIGALLHDLTKLSAGHQLGRSHSQIMRSQPSLAVEAAEAVVGQVEAEHGLELAPPRLDRIRHIVASHHGVWGKVRPATPEAVLVHRCDLYSANHHRLSPVDANDILPYLSEGCRWSLVSARLGVSRALVKARLQDACRAEQVREWVDLLDIWRAQGRVRPGSPDRVRQLERVRLIVDLARQVPDSILERAHPLYDRAEPSLLRGLAAAPPSACASARRPNYRAEAGPTWARAECGVDTRSRGPGVRPALAEPASDGVGLKERSTARGR